MQSTKKQSNETEVEVQFLLSEPHFYLCIRCLFKFIIISLSKLHIVIVKDTKSQKASKMKTINIHPLGTRKSFEDNWQSKV